MGMGMVTNTVPAAAQMKQSPCQRQGRRELLRPALLQATQCVLDVQR